MTKRKNDYLAGRGGKMGGVESAQGGNFAILPLFYRRRLIILLGSFFDFPRIFQDDVISRRVIDRVRKKYIRAVTNWRYDLLVRS